MMCRHSLRILYAVLFLCIASQNQMRAQLSPSPNLPIQVYFTESGRAGSSPAPALAELTATVDKKPAQLTSLRSANGDKLLFAVLVDMSGSEDRHSGSIKEVAFQIFQGLLEGGNEGYLVMFNGRIRASKKPLQLSEVRPALEIGKSGGATMLYDAISSTCMDLLSRSGNLETPRRAIILVTDGEDSASSTTPTRAKQSAEAEGVSIFSLQHLNESMSSGEVHHASGFLREASLATGGQTFQAKNVFDGVPNLLKAIREQWVLGIVPAQAPDQKFHDLVIKSSEKKVQISAPALLFVP